MFAQLRKCYVNSFTNMKFHQTTWNIEISVIAHENSHLRKLCEFCIDFNCSERKKLQKQTVYDWEREKAFFEEQSKEKLIYKAFISLTKEFKKKLRLLVMLLSTLINSFQSNCWNSFQAKVWRQLWLKNYYLYF